MVPFSGEITKEVSREIQECEAMKKTLVVCGLYRGLILLPSYIGIISLSHEIRIPSLTNQCISWICIRGFSFVAHLGVDPSKLSTPDHRLGNVDTKSTWIRVGDHGAGQPTR